MLYICLPLKFKEVSEKCWNSNRLSWKLFCFLLRLLPYKRRVENSCDLSVTVFCAQSQPSVDWVLLLLVQSGYACWHWEWGDEPLARTEKPQMLLHEQKQNREPTCKFDETACKFNETGTEAGIFRFRSLRGNSVDEWSWAVSWLSTGSWAPSCESIYTQTTEPIRGTQTIIIPRTDEQARSS